MPFAENSLVTHWYPAKSDEPGSRNGKIQKEVVIPPTVKAYNKFMGAVDSFDQYRSYIRLELRSSKFWHPMMWFVIEAALVNSWVLYKTTMEKAGKPLLYTALTFRKALALALASEWESMGCTLNDAVISPTKPFQSLHAKAARQKVVSTPTCDRFTCVQKHTQHQEKIPQKNLTIQIWSQRGDNYCAVTARRNVLNGGVRDVQPPFAQGVHLVS
jgi:hypothetical protein